MQKYLLGEPGQRPVQLAQSLICRVKRSKEVALAHTCACVHSRHRRLPVHCHSQRHLLCTVGQAPRALCESHPGLTSIQQSWVVEPHSLGSVSSFFPLSLHRTWGTLLPWPWSLSLPCLAGNG